jgi:pilus assembly protein CpaE
LFGTAANNGQMIAEVSSSHKINDIFKSIGLQVTGREGLDAAKAGAGRKLPGLFKKLKRAS